jgi:NADPH-dependent 2,4-dienoyl-CoA reductase/sulfur reductase-like enzyme
MAPKEKMVILGNGGAACNAAAAARQSGFQGSIQMISDVDQAAFNPMLGPYYLKGKTSWENCFPFGKDFYHRYDITCIFGSPVEALDAENRLIRCGDGRSISYDQCLIATGADPSFPPVPGLAECARAYPVRSSRTILKMSEALQDAQKLVILGASLVGIKLAEIMRQKNPDAEILLVDVTDQVMPNGAHPITAQYLKRYFEQFGVSVMLGCSLEGLEDEGEGVCCFFPESLIERADFIAVCTGIRPNIGFVDRNQVDVDAAVVIDQHARTSRDGLYAAGDCAQGFNRFSGKKEWMGTWGNACYQGRTAGVNMSGGSAAYPGMLPQHVSPFFGWTYAHIGDVNQSGASIRVETHGDPENGGFQLLVFDQDTLVGVNLINCLEAAGELKTRIIRGIEASMNP